MKKQIAALLSIYAFVLSSRAFYGPPGDPVGLLLIDWYLDAVSVAQQNDLLFFSVAFLWALGKPLLFARVHGRIQNRYF